MTIREQIDRRLALEAEHHKAERLFTFANQSRCQQKRAISAAHEAARFEAWWETNHRRLPVEDPKELARAIWSRCCDNVIVQHLDL